MNKTCKINFAIQIESFSEINYLNDEDCIIYDYVINPDDNQVFLHEKSFYKNHKLNDDSGHPAVTKYYLFSDKVKRIEYYKNGKLSRVNGPATINYDRNGNMESEQYIFNDQVFDCKEDFDKYIILYNIT